MASTSSLFSVDDLLISPGTDVRPKGAVALLIAFYLPQYHTIPENDEWWGPGFSEWTNVAASRKMFPGHRQPNIPGELGFYDLRLPETREAQASLARDHGIGAFCYWHYWFGNGKRLLERPFAEVLCSGKPEFPFCLAWANESWLGPLYGAPKGRLLIEQKYPGLEDHENHFEVVLPAFRDPRYVRIAGKPVFLVYRPELIPDATEFIELWQGMAKKSGLQGIYFIGIGTEDFDPRKYGFDASVLNEPRPVVLRQPPSRLDKLFRRLTGKPIGHLWNKIGLPLPQIFSYENLVQYANLDRKFDFMNYPVVVPNWDTTPRSGRHGVVFRNSTPALFRQHLSQALDVVSSRDPEQAIIFVKSWNEWAEGNHLEPDRRYGRAYLEVVRDLVFAKP